MTATRLPLVVERSATFDLNITYYQDEKQTLPVDLTGYTARLQIRPSADSAEIIYDSAGADGRLFSWLHIAVPGNIGTAGVADNVFPRFENWLRYGWTDTPVGGGWSMDKLIDLGVTKFILGWVWGQLDAGYVTGPYDPAWDPLPNGQPNGSTHAGCNPITEEQHRLLVGSSYINQVRASLGANTARRKKIKELIFYHGCCPASETATLSSGYDKYLASAIACNAAIMFDAEPVIKYEGATAVPGIGGVDPGPSGSGVDPVDPIDPDDPGDAALVVPPHRVLRQRMRELKLVAGMEPMPQKTASVQGWFQGSRDCLATYGYIGNALNRPVIYHWPWELRNAGKRHIELGLGFDPGFGNNANFGGAITRCKQNITDGYAYAFQFGMGDETQPNGLPTEAQIKDLVKFDRENSENGDITLGGAAGTIRLKIDPAVTKTLRPGQHNYDLRLTKPNGDVIRLIEGTVDIRPEVTQT